MPSASGQMLNCWTPLQLPKETKADCRAPFMGLSVFGFSKSPVSRNWRAFRAISDPPESGAMFGACRVSVTISNNTLR
jgi:hypothetical protein